MPIQTTRRAPVDHGAPHDAARPSRHSAVARLLQGLGLLALGSAAAAGAAAAEAAHQVLELRQYTLQAGQRDTLIALFEQHFIDSQEQTGLRVIGQFHDLERPDRFVWLRSFADMPARQQALGQFYGGPVWKAHREAANATMIDSDNVLLLRPAYDGSGFDLTGLQRPAPDAAAAEDGLVVASIYYLQQPATPALIQLLRTRLEPQLRSDGARVLASLVTEAAPNTFPQLPVRENESVLVVFAAYAGSEEYARQQDLRAASPAWRELDRRLAPYLQRAPETLRLAATRRSLLRGN